MRSGNTKNRAAVGNVDHRSQSIECLCKLTAQVDAGFLPLNDEPLVRACPYNHHAGSFDGAWSRWEGGPEGRASQIIQRCLRTSPGGNMGNGDVGPLGNRSATFCFDVR